MHTLTAELRRVPPPIGTLCQRRPLLYSVSCVFLCCVQCWDWHGSWDLRFSGWDVRGDRPLMAVFVDTAPGACCHTVFSASCRWPECRLRNTCRCGRLACVLFICELTFSYSASRAEGISQDQENEKRQGWSSEPAPAKDPLHHQRVGNVPSQEGVFTVGKEGLGCAPMGGRAMQEPPLSPLQPGIRRLACVYLVGLLWLVLSWKQGQKLGKLSVTESWPSAANC